MPIGIRRKVNSMKRLSQWTLVPILIATFSESVFSQGASRALTAGQVDQIVDGLQTAVKDYVFPGIAHQLQQEVKDHRPQYRTITDPMVLAASLTSDMRAVGHDEHLVVTFGEELGVKKNPTAEERQHAHDFDRADGYGIRSARRLPGNIGYIDIAYFSPDPDAGAAVASAMTLVNGTDALIIDLRRNEGGSGDTATTLTSYFLSDVTKLSSVVEHVTGETHERQHWSVAYVQGPRYLEKPLFILTSTHSHSAAEIFAYDLKNMHLATIVGDHTSGEATAGTGEITLGFGFSAFIPNGQMISPITHTNYIRVGVQPDVAIDPTKALVRAYSLALQSGKLTIDSNELAKEKAAAVTDPSSALLQEIDGFVHP
jgi:retinol-binding protein 3